MKRLISLKDYDLDLALSKQQFNKKNLNEMNNIKQNRIKSPKTKTITVKQKLKSSSNKNNKKYQQPIDNKDAKNSPLIKSIKLTTKKGSCSHLSYLVNERQKKQHFNSTKANSRSNIKSSYMTKQDDYDMNNSSQYMNNFRESISSKDRNTSVINHDSFKNPQLINSNNFYINQINNKEFSFENDNNIIEENIDSNSFQKYDNFQMTSPLMMSYEKQSSDNKILTNSNNNNIRTQKQNYQKESLNRSKKQKLKVSIKSSQKIQKEKYIIDQNCQNKLDNNKTLNKKKRKRVVSYSDYLKILDCGGTMNQSQHKKMIHSINNQQQKLTFKQSKNAKPNNHQNNQQLKQLKQSHTQKGAIIKKDIVLSLIRNPSSISKNSLSKSKNDNKNTLPYSNVSQISTKRKKDTKHQHNSSKIKTGQSYLYRNNSSINHNNKQRDNLLLFQQKRLVQANIFNKTEDQKHNPLSSSSFQLEMYQNQNNFSEEQDIGELCLMTVESSHKSKGKINKIDVKQKHYHDEAIQMNEQIGSFDRKSRPRKISLRQLKQSFVQQKGYYHNQEGNQVFNGPISMIQLNTNRYSPDTRSFENQYTSNYQQFRQQKNSMSKVQTMQFMYMKTLQVLNQYQRQLRQARAQIKHLKSRNNVVVSLNQKHKKSEQASGKVSKRK